MAELESQPLSDEERAELEELRAEKARREAQEKARREREELAALRAERTKAEEAAAKPAPVPASKSAPAPAPKPVPAAPKPQPKGAVRPKPAEPKPSRDEMTFAQRMVTSKEPTAEDEIPGMPPAQKIIIVLALIAFAVFMIYTITGSMGLH